ncbi:hypothetical protein ACQZ46_02500 [Agrobacterium salinitolerans]
MECNFTVGQKVVCVDGSAPSREQKLRLGSRYPDEGKIYTIRECLIWGGSPAVRLEEIVNPLLNFAFDGFSEQAFSPARFRPVIQRKTDISIFKAMLNPSKEQVSA